MITIAPNILGWPPLQIYSFLDYMEQKLMQISLEDS